MANPFAQCRIDPRATQSLLYDDAGGLASLLDANAALVDERDFSGQTLAMLAIGSRAIRCLELLIDRGADLALADVDGWTCLHHAAAHGAQPTSVVISRGPSSLLEARDADGWTPLMMAAQTRQLEAIDILARAGADLNATDEDGRSASFYAALNGKADSIRVLARLGADLDVKDSRGLGLLDVSSSGGRIECVQALLDAGVAASPTSLSRAIRGGNFEAVKILVEAGVDLNAFGQAPDDGPPALWAASCGHARILRFLACRGANVNLAAAKGLTAAMGAASGGYAECLIALREHGADFGARDHRGKTAEDFAKIAGEAACVAFFEALREEREIDTAARAANEPTRSPRSRM